MKDTRAYAFIGARGAATHCDLCQQELVGYERFTCCVCDPNAQEWEWDDRAGETWLDPDRALLFILGASAHDVRCLSCLVLDSTSWRAGAVVEYHRTNFLADARERASLERIA